MILHLGVVDIPYADGAETTGQVAQWLENKYGVMAAFVKGHRPQIEGAVHRSLADAMQLRLMGRNDVDDFGPALSEIKQEFSDFLTNSEIEGMGIEGVPTWAAYSGKSSRFKKGKNPAGRRPSFVDTGTYRAAFKPWVGN